MRPAVEPADVLRAVDAWVPKVADDAPADVERDIPS